MYTGEILSFGTVVSWTTCAMFGEVASRRMGTLPFNVSRMTLSIFFLSVLLFFLTGKPIPVDANLETWTQYWRVCHSNYSAVRPP